MSGRQDGDEIVEQIETLLSRIAHRLTEADARTEAIANLVAPRRILFLSREPILVPAGRVWPLGVLLLAPDATLYEAGSTTRAVEPGRPNYQSLSGEDRRAHRAAAVKAGFPPGQTVNFNANRINLGALESGSGRLFIRDGRPAVRWNASASAETSIGLEAYLEERASLLIAGSK